MISLQNLVRFLVWSSIYLRAQSFLYGMARRRQYKAKLQNERRIGKACKSDHLEHILDLWRVLGKKTNHGIGQQTNTCSEQI